LAIGCAVNFKSTQEELLESGAIISERVVRM